jgi:hypothetical protein
MLLFPELLVSTLASDLASVSELRCATGSRSLPRMKLEPQSEKGVAGSNGLLWFGTVNEVG